MRSRIAEAIHLGTQPVAILFAAEKPEGALQFKPGTWGCVVAFLKAAANGKTAAFDKETTTCIGGRAGLCFGNPYPDFPGGIEYFLSTGRGPGFREGEAYKKTPELARAFVDSLPYKALPTRYVVFRPLSEIGDGDPEPAVVSLFVDADQLAALVVLANYGRPTGDNVIVPFAAGCQSVCLLPYDESFRDRPRAVIGNLDITVRHIVGAGTLSFSMPYSLFREMEENVAGSFLKRTGVGSPSASRRGRMGTTDRPSRPGPRRYGVPSSSASR